MAQIERTILVARPIDETFDYVAAFEKSVRWDPAVVTSEKLSAGPPRKGSLFQLVLELGRGTTSMRYEITELDRPMRLELTGEGERFAVVHDLRFYPLDEDTRITWRASLRRRGVGRVTGLFSRGPLDRMVDDALAGLQDALIR